MDGIDRAIDETLDTAQRKDEHDTAKSRRTTYEKALKSVRETAGSDAMRELESWIVAEIREDASPPSSRNVRQKGAKIVREHGGEVSTNDWLGA